MVQKSNYSKRHSSKSCITILCLCLFPIYLQRINIIPVLFILISHLSYKYLIFFPISNMSVNIRLQTSSLLFSLVAQTVKCLPSMWEIRVWSLGQEDPLEKEMATHSSILAWKFPQMEEPSRLQSMGLQRVEHD